MREYIGLTIGPIYPTLKQARSTRELWGSSFLFSSIFMQVAVKLKSHVILPFVCDTRNSPIGLFPDRIILKKENVKGEKLDITMVYETINIIFSQIAKDCYNITDINNFDIALEQLKLSIQIHAYEIEIQDGQNIILQLYNQLDNMELFNQLPSIEEILPKYFAEINNSNLYKLAGWSREKKFPSIFDISAFSLNGNKCYNAFIEKYFKEVDYYDQTKDSNSKQFLESFIDNCAKTFGNDFKPYHKYFALVHADGDNMGRIASSIGISEDKIRSFSTALFEFGKDAGDIIQNYGGLPIYIGGDDLLFFAPLANSNGKPSRNILELIQELDEKFTKSHRAKILKLLDNSSTILSFSYGISVNYFKYPLKESLEHSYNNLKKAKANSNKNSIFITLQKHSGQQIEAGFEKGDSFYTQYLFDFIKNNCFSDKVDEYNSFRRKSAEYHHFLKYAGTYGASVSKFIQKKFDYDFDNNQYWNHLLKVLVATYSNPTEADRRIEMLFFAIRFIHFINSDQNE